MKYTFLSRLRAKVQRTIQTRLWGMDIHATAQVANTALIDRTWPKGIHIGADCTIGEEAVILTHDFTRGLYLDTYIGDRTRIGPRAIILPGLTIGNDCTVMPGALINRDLPPHSIAIGNPALISEAPRSLHSDCSAIKKGDATVRLTPD